MSAVIGRAAVALALLSVALGIVPGAISLMAAAASLGAVVLSLFSVGRGEKRYFCASVVLALFGMLVVNDGLRLWNPSPMPLQFRLGVYGIVALVLAVCSLAAYRYMRAEP